MYGVFSAIKTMKKKKTSGKNLLPEIKVRAPRSEIIEWTMYAYAMGIDRNAWIREALSDAMAFRHLEIFGTK